MFVRVLISVDGPYAPAPMSASVAWLARLPELGRDAATKQPHLAGAIANGASYVRLSLDRMQTNGRITDRADGRQPTSVWRFGLDGDKAS